MARMQKSAHRAIISTGIGTHLPRVNRSPFCARVVLRFSAWLRRGGHATVVVTGFFFSLLDVSRYLPLSRQRLRVAGPVLFPCEGVGMASRRARWMKDWKELRRDHSESEEGVRGRDGGIPQISHAYIRLHMIFFIGHFAFSQGHLSNLNTCSVAVNSIVFKNVTALHWLSSITKSLWFLSGWKYYYAKYCTFNFALIQTAV